MGILKALRFSIVAGIKCAIALYKGLRSLQGTNWEHMTVSHTVTRDELTNNDKV